MNFFVAYSGRNIEKVAAIMYFLSEEMGSNRFWFAPTQSFEGRSIQETLRNAIQEAKAVISFESGSTYRTMNTDEGKRDGLSQRSKLILYEREEAIRLSKKIVNVAITSPEMVGLNPEDRNTFDLSMSLRSKVGQENIREILSYLKEI